MKFPKFGSKHNKNPQQHKSKEEMLADLKKNGEFIMKMKFIREKFYPALIDATDTIEDATMLLYGFNANMMEQFLGFMKEKKVSDLKLEDKLDKQSPKHEKHLALLNLFQDMNIFTAKEYIEGLRNEIEAFKMDYFKEKSLAELKTRWIDEI